MSDGSGIRVVNMIHCIFSVIWNLNTGSSLGYIRIHIKPSLNGNRQPLSRLCQKLGIWVDRVSTRVGLVQ